jgi:glucose-like phosphotransferase system IIB component
MDKYTRTAAALRDLLGGPDNIVSLAHCVTRLRLTLADRTRVDDTTLRDHPAVLGVLDRDTFQIVVGPAAVTPLAAALAQLLDAGNHRPPPTAHRRAGTSGLHRHPVRYAVHSSAAAASRAWYARSAGRDGRRRANSQWPATDTASAVTASASADFHAGTRASAASADAGV